LDTSSTNTLGKYQIIREIARSNDIVYEAIDPSINRRVALKELLLAPTLQAAQRQERIERFWREGKAAGRLSHPNIVTVFEVGKDGDRYFIAMEYLEGQTLRDLLQSGGPLPIQTAVNYALQLCSALAYAHKNGVIHRDVKPENVQILPGDHIKLTDFGIARLVGEPGITQDGQVFGTPSYMSPEQVAGKPLDARSDLFSLGVMLYEMIAGKKPFAGESVVTITYNIVNMDPSPPPGAPPYLIGIIRKAMAKDPDGRYFSADDMAEDLREQKSDAMLTMDPLANTYPSPFGGAPPQATQQSHQQQVPITPYGTPMPSPGAGSYAPDPFSQGPPVSTAPPPIPRPAMNPDTKNFLGIFLLTIGIAGMVLFAIWVISIAYKSYETATTTQAAAKYYEQAVKLHTEGKLDLAEQQYQNAIRVSPNSKAAEGARDGVYKIWTARAYTYSQIGDMQQLSDLGRKMVEADDKKPEGHYYLGLASELARDYAKAAEEYQRASDLAGNDQAGYGPAARSRLEQIHRQHAEQSPDLSSGGASVPQPEPRQEKSPIPYEGGSNGGG